MEIVRSDLNKNIIINTETEFIPNINWNDTVQKFEQDTLQDIINPKLNFETSRFIHQPYNSSNGITQNDLWFYFYFYSDNGTTHQGGLNYEFVGLSSIENSKLTVNTSESFFRLDFYKIPTLSDDTLDYFNKKLVFTKNLKIPLGEKIFYKTINDYIYVPIFMGSNYRNDENMNIYWFSDDTVLSDSKLTGNTFYMTARYFNSIDGSVYNFTKTGVAIGDTHSESDNTYYTVTINRNDNTYYITGSGRYGTSDNPIKFYVTELGNSSYPLFIWKGSNITDPDYLSACDLYSTNHTYYTPGSEIFVGSKIYTDKYFKNEYVGQDEFLTLSLNGNGLKRSYLFDSNNTVIQIINCPLPCGTLTLNSVTCMGNSDFILNFSHDNVGYWINTRLEYSFDGGSSWTNQTFPPNISTLNVSLYNPLFNNVSFRLIKICGDNESDASNIITTSPKHCEFTIKGYLDTIPFVPISWVVYSDCASGSATSELIYSYDSVLTNGLILYTDTTLLTVVSDNEYILEYNYGLYIVNTINGVISDTPVLCCDLVCDIPVLYSVVYSGGNTFTLSVNSSGLGTCEQIQTEYSLDGGTTWVTSTVTCSPYIDVTTSTSATIYQFRIKKLCLGTVSNYSNTISFNACEYSISATIK